MSPAASFAPAMAVELRIPIRGYESVLDNDNPFVGVGYESL